MDDRLNLIAFAVEEFEADKKDMYEEEEIDHHAVLRRLWQFYIDIKSVMTEHEVQ